ncbi:LegC family aminotransferase [Microbulbifer sediminum]|uniref:LegC family aminotransferase n=1 Tax=Microbulbifer sediminum TaxID=2904250 RepID=UPI001F1C45CE|nr:LegC family aminotransferase [Microbulbifer sediminum]
MHQELVKFVREIYSSNEVIPLHAPIFAGNESKYVTETIDSTFVSSVGKFVDEFESQIENYTKCKKAVATVNGTSALHTALYMSDVQRGDMVITQALTFVATCNVLYHMGVEPVFVDVSMESMGLCPMKTGKWLDENAFIDSAGECRHKFTNRKISAILPMHTFGHPVQLDGFLDLCSEWNLKLIEDAAESLGSFYRGQHTGTFGKFSALSFNGNKVITTGGGGMVLCQSDLEGARTKHITTTAKVSHPFEFFHDEPGFNYRLPNINAALGCAQLENIGTLLDKKRQIANNYMSFFNRSDYVFFKEPEYAKSNYWLNCVICPTKKSRDQLLLETNRAGVMTRPIWKLMSNLPAFKHCLSDDLSNSKYLEEHAVNIPSGISKELM